MKRPDPENYEDYRAYLRDLVVHLQKTQKSFSYRQFARRAGFASPSFLKSVVDGTRELPAKSVPKFAKGLGLSAEETDALETLVLLENASDDAARNRLYERMRRRRKRADKIRLLEESQYEVYSEWYVLAVREMLALPDFVEDPKWIAERLFPRVKLSDAARALELLERTGLAVRDNTGRLRVADPTISTPLQVRSLAIRNYHRIMLKKSSDALNALPREERNITCLNVALSAGQYEEICRRIAQHQEEFLEYAGRSGDRDRDPGESREVYYIGFQVVPITRRKERS